MQVLTVPGIHGSGPDHWQSAWEQLPARRCRRFAPLSFDDPDPWNWVEAIERGVADLGPGCVVVAHSLGCLAAAHVAATSAGMRGVVLVAPPDVRGPSFPPAARGFDELLPTPLRVPSLMIVSSDDPYCATTVSARLAARWGAPQIELGPLGHLNEASGLGGWDAGWDLVTAFVAGTGPGAVSADRPRPAGEDPRPR